MRQAEAAAWLVAALGDRSPVVRDTAVRALACRRERADAVPALAQLAATDLVWRGHPPGRYPAS